VFIDRELRKPERRKKLLVKNTNYFRERREGGRDKKGEKN